MSEVVKANVPQTVLLQQLAEIGGNASGVEDIAAVPLLSGVMDNEDANAVVIGKLFQTGQILVVLGIGIDLFGSIVPHHLEGID